MRVCSIVLVTIVLTGCTGSTNEGQSLLNAPSTEVLTFDELLSLDKYSRIFIDQDQFRIQDEIDEITYTDVFSGNRNYVNNSFQYDLLKVIGHEATLVQDNDGNSRFYNVEAVNFLDTNQDIEVKYPENGLIKETHFTRNQQASIDFFIGGGSLQENEIYHLTITDVASIIIDDRELDLTKLSQRFPDYESAVGKFLITNIVMTEIKSRKFQSKSKRTKLKNLPAFKSVISIDDSYFSSNMDYQKNVKVSVGLSEISVILGYNPS